MALDFQGVKVSVTKSKLPAGYVEPVITIVDGEYKTTDQVLVIDKIDFAMVSSSDGFDALLAKISELVQIELNENFKTDTANFEAYSDFTDVKTNQAVNEQVYTTETYTVSCMVTTYVIKV